MEKALICINSCKRFDFFKAFVWPILSLVRENKDFDFILSLDGKDIRYINFCKRYQIPIIYSDEQEGIGIAKNRVLASFTDYDYYFFLDDDVEILNSSIFSEVIKIANANNIPHITLGQEHRFLELIKNEKPNEKEIKYANYGPGTFSFFTNAGIKKVGGFHTEFAKYRRFGHTEHSYRFVNNKLQETAFVSIPSLSDYCLWHEPKSVSKTTVSLSEQFIAQPEVELIGRKLLHFPITTMSNVYLENTSKSIKYKNLQRVCKLSRYMISLRYRLGLI